MTQPGRPGRNPLIWTVVGVLLAAGVLGTLVVPIYARSTPKLGAFPFFYWYQLLWIPLVAILAWVSYLLTRKASRGTRQEDQGTRQEDQGRRDESR
jgi:membrane protein implicated in regulation of membrane protease activity